ncbi:MAG: ATP-binding protein [Deltaproteobacteria bacterium]|nr:ATP-binding protein [Deltaproteobacteria bacterium]
MTEQKLTQAHGNWVIEDRFWDREVEISLFNERVREGAHILLVAQRRMGKTSLMKEAARRLGNGHTCVYVDFQAARTPADAVAELSLNLRPHKKLWAKTKEIFANIFSTATQAVEELSAGDIRLTLRAGMTAGNWAAKADQLMGVLAKSEEPVLLLLDEVPIMVNRFLKGDDFTITPERRAMTDEFMSWLRRNMIQHKGKICIAVSGSIGFEPVLRQAKLSGTLSVFSNFDLKPWDDETAIGCLTALSNEYGVTLQAGAPEAMIANLGSNIPHHVQMFFSHGYTFCKRKQNMALSVDDVAEVYRSEMLSTRGHAELTHYEERLTMVLGPDLFSLALELLTEAAVTGQLSGEAVLALHEAYSEEIEDVARAVNDVLAVLEHDGYLTLEAGGYSFVSRLLRDWWKARHGFAFTPVLERAG